MTFLDRLTEPSKTTLDCMRMASILRVNDVIELVRELRDAPILPEEQPEQIQKIMTALSQLKAGLMVGGMNDSNQS